MPAGGLIGVSYNEFFPVPGVTLAGVDWAPGARVLRDSAAASSGDFVAELPLDVLGYSTVGAGKVASFFDDYYNRIFFTPTSLDFGTIEGPQSRSVEVWNAYLDRNVSLLSVDTSSVPGVQVSTGGLPVVFAPLQQRSFLLTANEDGPATINGAARWFFNIPYNFPLQLTGLRAKQWSVSPSWPPRGKSYQVTYDFRTEILTSRNAKEQRICLRNSPRKSLNYECQLINEELRAFKDLMWLWQQRAFVTPDWARFVQSTSRIASGSREIAIDASPAWLLPATQVLVSDGFRSELRLVEEVLDGVLYLVAQLDGDWPVGTKVYQGLSGYMDTTLSAPRETNTVAKLTVNFAVSPLSEQFIEPAPASQVFNGRELFLKRPNWIRGVQSSMSHEVDELDYDRGPVFRATPVAYGSESRRATYVNRNVAEVDEVLAFFFRMRGRQGEFYMPTWEYDFVPKVAASSGSSALRVAGYRLADSYGTSTVMKAMFVLLNNGTLITRKVISVARVNDSGGQDSVITVQGSWGVTVSEDTIIMSGWLPAWRLSSDSLTVEWLTNTVAQTQLTMQTLEDLPVETLP